MCFIIDKKHPKEKVAKKNITCYKSVYIKLCIIRAYYFHNFIYKLNKVYQTTGLKVQKNNFGETFINEGFHSYSNNKGDIDICSINKVKCIIPKGSKYYYNSEHRQYVSNRIILTELLTNNQTK